MASADTEPGVAMSYMPRMCMYLAHFVRTAGLQGWRSLGARFSTTTAAAGGACVWLPRARPAPLVGEHTSRGAACVDGTSTQGTDGRHRSGALIVRARDHRKGCILVDSSCHTCSSRAGHGC